MNTIKKARLLSVRGAKQGADEQGDSTSVGIWIPQDGLDLQHDPELSSEEEQKVEQLKEYVATIALKDDDSYAKWEKRWLSDKTYERYLRAEDFKLEKAKERIKATMEWRRDYKPDLITPKEVSEEVEGGKIVVTGFTLHGMPVVYLRPARENTEPSDTQVRHMVFQLERAIELLPDGVSKVCLVCDFKGTSAKSSPPMKITKSVIAILQKHYPERLGLAVVTRLPWYLKSFFTTISPFLDEKTRSKLKMNPDLTEIIPKEQLDADLGGDYHFEYKHEVYLPAICEFCGVAEDGTRNKDEAGPEEDYEEGVTPGLAPSNKRKMSTQSAGTHSSRTLVADPEQMTKKDGKAQSPERKGAAKQSQRPSKRGGLFASCFPSHAGEAYEDDDEQQAAVDRARKRELHKRSSRGSFREGLHRMAHPRKSAMERLEHDADAQRVEHPEEAREIEEHFKRGEPIHASPDDPEVVQALEASARADMDELPLVSHSPKSGFDNVKTKAAALLRSTSDNETGRLRAPTSDHAQVVRPGVGHRQSTVAADDLTFSVGN